jgi:papain like protease
LDGRLLNAEPSRVDPDDIPFLGNAARGLPPPVLAPSFRHTGIGWPILDQGVTGTCGGQAGTGLRQWQELRENHPIDKFNAFKLYDLCLKADGNPDPKRMRGTTAKTVMTVLRDKGTPLESPRGAFAGKIASFEKLVKLDEDAVKEAIKANGPVLVRLDWDVAWGESKLLPGRILPDPTKEKGGHIFLLFGWDDDVNQGSFLMRNTWGNWIPRRGTSPTPKKAGNGNAYLRYDFFLKPARKAEVWVSVDVLRGPLPPG